MIDATQIPQPDWSDVFQAFLNGAIEATANREAKIDDYRRAADAYCKLVLHDKSADVFDALGR